MVQYTTNSKCSIAYYSELDKEEECVGDGEEVDDGLLLYDEDEEEDDDQLDNDESSTID